MPAGKFATAINCMDGRVQDPIIQWFKIRMGYDYVDSITEPGPIKILTDGDPINDQKIKDKVLISTEQHGSDIIAIVGHDDCAGHPVPKEEQLLLIDKAIEVVNGWNTGARVIGLYVSENTWSVEVVRE